MKFYANYQEFLDSFADLKARKQEISIEKMTSSYLEAYQTLI